MSVTAVFGSRPRWIHTPRAVRPRGERRAVGLRRRADGVIGPAATLRDDRAVLQSPVQPAVDGHRGVDLGVDLVRMRRVHAAEDDAQTVGARRERGVAHLDPVLGDRPRRAERSVVADNAVREVVAELARVRAPDDVQPVGRAQERHLAGRRRRRHGRDALPVGPCGGGGREREPCCGEDCDEGAPGHQAGDRNRKDPPVGGIPDCRDVAFAGILRG